MSLWCDVNPLCVAKQAGVGLAQAAFGGILHSIASGITDIVGTLLNEVMMSSNGAAQVKGSSFTSLYGAMLVPAMVLSVIVLVIAVTMAAIQGRAGEVAKRALLVPIGVFLIVGAAAALVNDALDLVSFIDGTYIQAALGAGGFKTAFGQMGFNATGNLQLLNTAAEIPNAVFQIFIGIFLLIATFAIWVEMQVRTLAIWILVAVVPLASAGLFWSGTQRWLKRLIEALVAAILTPIPITIVLSIGAKLGMGTDSLSKLMLAFVTMMLAAFSLPMLLKLVPLAEMMAVSGIAAAGMGHAGTAARSAVDSATKDAPSAVKRLAGPVSGGASGIAKGMGSATGTAAAGIATGGLAVAAKAAGFAKSRITGSVAGKDASASSAVPEPAPAGAHVPSQSSPTGPTKPSGGGGGGAPAPSPAPSPAPTTDPAQTVGGGGDAFLASPAGGGGSGGGGSGPAPAPMNDPATTLSPVPSASKGSGTTPSTGPSQSPTPLAQSARTGAGPSKAPGSSGTPSTGPSQSPTPLAAPARTGAGPSVANRGSGLPGAAISGTGTSTSPATTAPRSSATGSSDGLNSPVSRTIPNFESTPDGPGSHPIANFDPGLGPTPSPPTGSPESASRGASAPRLFDVEEGRVPRTHYGPKPHSKTPRKESDPPPRTPRRLGG
ncbi:MAG: TrbL/VirB6 family protein [Acidimicrobiales bacterium]